MNRLGNPAGEGFGYHLLALARANTVAPAPASARQLVPPPAAAPKGRPADFRR
jgi:hypothetical protein